MKPSLDRFVIALIVLYVLASFIVSGCTKNTPAEDPPRPVIIVLTDGGDPSDLSDGGFRFPWCRLACENLRTYQCGDGYTPAGLESCYAVCAHAESSKKLDFRPQCIAEAKSADAIRACGTYRCLPLVIVKENPS